MTAALLGHVPQDSSEQDQLVGRYYTKDAHYYIHTDPWYKTRWLLDLGGSASIWLGALLYNVACFSGMFKVCCDCFSGLFKVCCDCSRCDLYVVVQWQRFRAAWLLHACGVCTSAAKPCLPLWHTVVAAVFLAVLTYKVLRAMQRRAVGGILELTVQARC